MSGSQIILHDVNIKAAEALPVPVTDFERSHAAHCYMLFIFECITRIERLHENVQPWAPHATAT